MTGDGNNYNFKFYENVPPFHIILYIQWYIYIYLVLPRYKILQESSDNEIPFMEANEVEHGR